MPPAGRLDSKPAATSHRKNTILLFMAGISEELGSQMVPIPLGKTRD